MRTALKEAAEIAIRELKMGRKSLILIPSGRWIKDTTQLGKPPRGVLIAVASQPATVRGVRVDTLITVGVIPTPVLHRAKSVTRTSSLARWINVGEVVTTVEGSKVWS